MPTKEKSAQVAEEFVMSHSALYMSLCHLAGLFGYGEQSPVTEFTRSLPCEVLKSLASYVRENQPEDIGRLLAMYPAEFCRTWMAQEELELRAQFLQERQRAGEYLRDASIF